MSLLYLRARPMVAFDVNNEDHRRYFREFVKYNTWGKCPVRFMAESMDLDLVSYINQKMLNYYVNQEFENVKSKNTTKAKPRPQGAFNTVRGKHTIQTKTGRIKDSVSTQTKTSRIAA
jgi:hypothetical protein